MDGPHAMTTRYAKIAMTLALAAFAFLAMLNNLTDYGSNFAFVRHVLSMTPCSPTTANCTAPSTPLGSGTRLMP